MERATDRPGPRVSGAVLLCAAVLAIAAAAPARADLPGLQLETAPDIYSGGITTSYDADGGTLEASGYAVLLKLTPEDGSARELISSGTFELVASMSSAGVGNSGSLVLQGAVPSLGIGSVTTLLQATVTEIAYTAVTGILEILGTIEAGALAQTFGGVGARLGTLLGTAVNQDFGSSWSSSLNSADTAPPYEPGPEVPEPRSVAWLAALAVAVAAARRSLVAR